MAIRTTNDRLQQNIIDKNISLAGDVILDDANIATIATQTTTSATNSASIEDNTYATSTSTNNVDVLSFGKNGLTAVAASSTVEVDAGTYYAVQFINDTVVSVLAGTSCDGTLAGTYPAGCILYMDVTDLETGTGGPVMLYKVNESDLP